VRFEPVPLAEAEGKILGHNIAGENGQRLLRKGRQLSAADLEALRALGRQAVYVAQLEAQDVDENRAARRVAAVICGVGVTLPGAASGRANLLASELGILRVDVERLAQINDLKGITLATLANHSPVQARQMIATVKVIPYAVPESTVSEAEVIASGSRPIVSVDALPSSAVGLILSGSTSVHQKLLNDFVPLRDRIERLGSAVTQTDFVALDDESDEAALAAMLRGQLAAGVKLILLAGETAIMDEQDIIPRAIERAGGQVESVGAPVDPGNLLMLAYIEGVPVVGAPGCARSRKINIVDWVLPRLLVGDRLTRRDIVGLGHGGLLENVAERGMSRDIKEADIDKQTDLEPTELISSSE